MCTYLELGMLVHVLGPLPVEDELGLVGHSHDVVLHGVAQEPGRETSSGDREERERAWRGNTEGCRGSRRTRAQRRFCPFSSFASPEADVIHSGWIN